MPNSSDNLFNSLPFLSQITENLVDSVYLLDPKTSNVLWVNKAGYQDLGMDKEEVLNHSVLSLQKMLLVKCNGTVLLRLFECRRNIHLLEVMCERRHGVFC